MKELVQILSLQRPAELVDQLVSSGYSFAAWRMPNAKDHKFIISLKETVPNEEIQISELPAGFLLNAYNDNHPIKPYHISADIVIDKKEIQINPSVNAQAIDEFKERIKSTTARDNASATASFFPNDFVSLVQNAIHKIKEGVFEKVVLSRYKDEPKADNFSSWEFFTKISETYLNAFCSLSFIPGKGMWIGASPELLISDNQEQFKTVALAGTKRLEENQNLGEIAWTQKEIEEQALVSRYIINCFKKIRLREFHEHGPKTVQAGNLAHLKTEFVVDYNEVSFDGLSDQMVELLHPTSAVCGMPIESAKPWIEKEENYDREFYSGFLGPVNFDGSTDLFVNLRCMKITDSQIRFYAGAGLTEDSNPQKEFEETEMKMNVLKSLFIEN